MTLRHLAWANVRGSLQRYVAYFSSCVFSVMTFYIFLSFLVHPEVVTGRIVRNARVEMNRMLSSAEVIILIFSFLFILYSTTAFVRARKKEFGLLTLMGMTQRQMRGMVFIENGIIALAALTAGLGLGVIFSKLFFLAASSVLGIGERIPFAIPPLAVAGTVGAFTGLFLSVNVVSLLGVRSSSISELLKAHRGPKHTPRPRPLLLLLGLGLLAAGYRLAWVTDGMTFVTNTFPILGLTIAGTYFIVTQGSVLLGGWLQRRQRFYLRGTNLLVVNRLRFRLVETAQVIFISAILIAVVGSALGGFNSLLQGAKGMAEGSQAYELSVQLSDQGNPTEVQARILDYLDERGARDLRSQVVTYFTSAQGDRHTMVVPAASYNRAAEVTGVFETVVVGPGQAYGISSYGDRVWPETVDIQASTESSPANFAVIGQTTQWWLGTGDVVVLNDADFAALYAQATQRTNWVGFSYENWRGLPGLSGDINQVAGAGNLSLVVSKVEVYQAYRQSGALTMFIGVFIAGLFFVIAGSLIYFKLFTELDDDRRQYGVLRKLGLTSREFGRAVSQELGVLFFLPLAFGALHTVFALKTLWNLIPLQLDLLTGGLMIGGAYLLAQGLYFLIARSAYVRQVAGG